MLRQVILMITLRLVKRFKLVELGGDRLIENLRLVQLIDVRPSDPLLLVVRIKNCRAILRAPVGTLSFLFCWNVDHREKHLQQLAIGNL